MSFDPEVANESNAFPLAEITPVVEAERYGELDEGVVGNVDSEGDGVSRLCHTESLTYETASRNHGRRNLLGPDDVVHAITCLSVAVVRLVTVERNVKAELRSTA